MLPKNKWPASIKLTQILKHESTSQIGSHMLSQQKSLQVCWHDTNSFLLSSCTNSAFNDSYKNWVCVKIRVWISLWVQGVDRAVHFDSQPIRSGYKMRWVDFFTSASERISLWYAMRPEESMVWFGMVWWQVTFPECGWTCHTILCGSSRSVVNWHKWAALKMERGISTNALWNRVRKRPHSQELKWVV
jgi:hypothetical protein